MIQSCRKAELPRLCSPAQTPFRNEEVRKPAEVIGLLQEEGLAAQRVLAEVEHELRASISLGLRLQAEVDQKTGTLQNMSGKQEVLQLELDNLVDEHATVQADFEQYKQVGCQGTVVLRGLGAARNDTAFPPRQWRARTLRLVQEDVRGVRARTAFSAPPHKSVQGFRKALRLKSASGRRRTLGHSTSA